MATDNRRWTHCEGLNFKRTTLTRLRRLVTRWKEKHGEMDSRHVLDLMLLDVVNQWAIKTGTFNFDRE